MLNVRHLTVLNRSGEPILQDVSFETHKGEILGVIGPNNAGKSVLLATLADPDTRFEGEVVINHFHSRSEPQKVKSQIGYVSPNAPLIDYLTGYEYIELLSNFYHLGKDELTKRLLELARKFDCLSDLYNLIERQSPATRQKIALIASLVYSPPVILWDEPFIFLDPTAKKIAIEELKLLAKSGQSIVLASNDLVTIEELCSRILVLDHGQLVGEGSPTQLQHLANLHKKSLADVYQHLVGDERSLIAQYRHPALVSLAPERS